MSPERYLEAARQALHMTRGDRTAKRHIRVKPSCGCVFCDLALPIYRDDRGFYHDGPEDTRISCEVSNGEVYGYDD